MAFRLSTGAVKYLLSDSEQIDTYVSASTISMGDGDGAVISGADTINDSGSGFGSFGKHDWLLVMSGDANANVLVKALDVAAGKIEVKAGSFAAVSAGSVISIIKTKGGGNLMRMLRNSTLVVRDGSRPASADLAETGTILATYTKDGNAFAAGTSENGLNLAGDIGGTTLNRAVDPETDALESWQSQIAADGTAGWGRWYNNDFVTGATSEGIHMDGVVNTSGADINMAGGTTLVTNAISNITSVTANVSGV